MRSRCVLLVLLSLCPFARAQETASPRFRYEKGQVLVAVEHVQDREIDPRIGYRMTRSYAVERRYTVLEVDDAGNADVVVEVRHGPQRLHEYTLRDEDARAERWAGRFDPDETVQARVLRVQFSPTRFRCEPSRDEPAVYYLQELPETMAHALRLPEQDVAQFEYDMRTERLLAQYSMRKEGERFFGEMQLVVRDPRVRGGEALRFAPSRASWRFDADRGLPAEWRMRLHYVRMPVSRPNERVITGTLLESAPLGAEALAQFRADYETVAAVREAFFAGHFAQARALGAKSLEARPQSALRWAIEAELAAFARQVPRYGETPAELVVAAAFGQGAESGAEGTLAGLRGKVVVLDFWATWCKPCVAGMEGLIALQEELGGEGLRVLGLTREDRQQKTADVQEFHARGYAAAHGGARLNYPLLVLEGDALHDWFAIRAIPKLVVLGRDGRVLWEQTGAGGEARLRRIVRAALD